MESKMDIKELLATMPDVDIGTAMDLLAKQDPALFCMFYRKLRGQPLTFDNQRNLLDSALAAVKAKLPAERYQLEVQSRLLKHRPFLLQPMRDSHPHKVYEKARQIGISELSITETVHFLWANPGTKSIYTFPRDSQLKDFSVTRISEMFAETARIASLLGTPNQVYTKRIGQSYMILRSAWESNLGEGIDADMVTLDEKDRMKDGVDIAFRESMKSSKYGWLREVSTPTLPGRGVDLSFRESDQMTWLVRCNKCNAEQEIEYPDNIIQVKHIPVGVKELPPDCYEYLCRKIKCRGALNRNVGRWIPKHPERKNIRGYALPQTIAPWIAATRLMQDKINYKFVQLWFNYCLGKPAMGENVLLSDADFSQACSGHQLQRGRTKDWIDISVGIDWGHLNWVSVVARNVHNQRLYLIGLAVFEDNHADALASVKDVENFIAPFQPDIIIADAGYGKDRNAYLLKRFSPDGLGRFWACWYNPSTKASRTFQPVWSTPAQARLLVDRTMTIKLTCRAIKEREFGLPDLAQEYVGLLVKHFKNLAPLRVEEEGEIVEDISCTGDDHLVHATGYALIGLDKLSNCSKFSFDFI
jgi:hypothetical protein